MITFEWADELDEKDRKDLAALLAEAVEYDAEAGFSTAAPEAPARGTVHHLLVKMPPRGERGDPALDDLPDVPVVAYLRVDVVDGAGEAQFVVLPPFRSLGVGTLLFERLRDEPTGWSALPGLTSVRAWAHGAHPAADRMAGRFGAQLTDAVFKTLRLVGGSRPYEPADQDLAESLAPTERPVAADVAGEAHALTLAPADRKTLSRITDTLRDADTGVSVSFGVDGDSPSREHACIAVDRPGDLKSANARLLLSRALVEVQGGGARTAQLYVNPLDDEVLGASRSLEFSHDQSDLRYDLRVD